MYERRPCWVHPEPSACVPRPDRLQTAAAGGFGRPLSGAPKHPGSGYGDRPARTGRCVPNTRNPPKPS